MSKVAIVVLAENETHGDLGRAFNAIEAAKEFNEAGDDVKLIFDGAGTTWIPEFDDPEHDAHPIFEAVKPVAGACSFCAEQFHVKDEVRESGVDFISEYEGHPSMKKLVDEGYEVITF